MRPGHALHGWKSAFSNFIIHKVLSQSLQTASISAIHVQSAQGMVLKVPMELKGMEDQRHRAKDGVQVWVSGMGL